MYDDDKSQINSINPYINLQPLLSPNPINMINIIWTGQHPRYADQPITVQQNEVSTYGFETPRKSACKHLWKCCVEHHAFFRLVRVAPIQPQTGTSELFALGSRFRYR